MKKNCVILYYYDSGAVIMNTKEPNNVFMMGLS